MPKPKRKLSTWNKLVKKYGSITEAKKHYSKKSGTVKSSLKSKKSRSSKTTGVRKMARSNGFNMQKIYGLVRKGALVAPAASKLLNPSLSNEQKIIHTLGIYTGYDLYTKTFKWERLAEGWMPYIASNLVTRGIPAINKLIRSIV